MFCIVYLSCIKSHACRANAIEIIQKKEWCYFQWTRNLCKISTSKTCKNTVRITVHRVMQFQIKLHTKTTYNVHGHSQRIYTVTCNKVATQFLKVFIWIVASLKSFNFHSLMNFLFLVLFAMFSYAPFFSHTYLTHLCLFWNTFEAAANYLNTKYYLGYFSCLLFPVQFNRKIHIWFGLGWQTKTC